MSELDGKTALVTGGGKGIGKAISQALAGMGARVVVNYRSDKTAAEETAASLPGASAHKADVGDPAQVDAMVKAIGRVDILVNNAAWNTGVPFTDLESLTPEIWDRMYATNLRGPYLLARAVARTMQKQGEGRIVNIASVGGLYSAASSIAYASTKAALIHLTRCLAVAMAPKVLVNCVAPGLIEGTRMAERIPKPLVATVLDRALLNKGASARDIAEQVVTFCRTDTTTGQVLAIDSGFVFH
ncbi:MAG: 3-oxoacyl-[acyl-carrier-protein] reductase [Candidatus Dormibacteraceae bacterium]